MVGKTFVNQSSTEYTMMTVVLTVIEIEIKKGNRGHQVRSSRSG